MRLTLVTTALSLATAAAQAPNSRPPSAPPASATRPVVDEYQGVKVVDPYRWLENWDDPAVRDWTERQNAYTRARLDALPFMPAIRERVKVLGSNTHPSWFDLVYRRPRIFAMKRQPPREQPMLVALTSADDLTTERIVVDPNRLNPKGTTAIDFYVPSRDGRLVAVSLSEGGTESGDVHVFEVDTGRDLGNVVPRVNGGTAGGSVAWNADASGFYYTRYPRAGERAREDLDFFQQIYFHNLGSPTQTDTYSIGNDFPRIAETLLESSPDGRFVLATVLNGDGGERAQYVLPPGGSWIQISTFADQAVQATWGRDDGLYVMSRKGAPRGKILKLSLTSSKPLLAQAQTLVPTSDAAIQRIEVTDGRLYVTDVVGGPSQVRVFDLQGHAQPQVPIQPVSTVGAVVGMDGDAILFRAQSYVDPPAFYRYRPGGGPQKTALAAVSAADFSDIETERATAISKDGTRVPLTIVKRKGTALNGRNPTLLYGYGGYGVSSAPSFSAVRRTWLEQGGVYVVANIRGGGEFGDEWHEAGKLTNKQNVFDDFAACARYLVDRRYTSVATLAIEGGSNGGLLMGATLTQHPGFVRAVVSHVGIYDSLRSELWPNGAFNTTEFGTVKDPAQFKALYAYSPFHQVVDGTAYPATLLLSGINDPRVNPADSRKFTARLQAATSSGLPVLLRISGSGHGIGTALSEQLAQQADVFAFLFWQLGVKYVPPQRGRSQE